MKWPPDAPTAPIDQTHAEQLAHVRQLRDRLARVLQDVARWEPRPYPSPWTEGGERRAR